MADGRNDFNPSAPPAYSEVDPLEPQKPNSGPNYGTSPIPPTGYGSQFPQTQPGYAYPPPTTYPPGAYPSGPPATIYPPESYAPGGYPPQPQGFSPPIPGGYPQPYQAQYTPVQPQGYQPAPQGFQPAPQGLHPAPQVVVNDPRNNYTGNCWQRNNHLRWILPMLCFGILLIIAAILISTVRPSGASTDWFAPPICRVADMANTYTYYYQADLNGNSCPSVFYSNQSRSQIFTIPKGPIQENKDYYLEVATTSSFGDGRLGISITSFIFTIIASPMSVYFGSDSPVTSTLKKGDKIRIVRDAPGLGVFPSNCPSGCDWTVSENLIVYQLVDGLLSTPPSLQSSDFPLTLLLDSSTFLGYSGTGQNPPIFLFRYRQMSSSSSGSAGRFVGTFLCSVLGSFVTIIALIFLCIYCVMKKMRRN